MSRSAPRRTRLSAPVIGGVHEEGERHLEGILDLVRIEDEACAPDRPWRGPGRCGSRCRSDRARDSRSARPFPARGRSPPRPRGSPPPPATASDGSILPPGKATCPACAARWGVRTVRMTVATGSRATTGISTAASRKTRPATLKSGLSTWSPRSSPATGGSRSRRLAARAKKAPGLNGEFGARSRRAFPASETRTGRGAGADGCRPVSVDRIHALLTQLCPGHCFAALCPISLGRATRRRAPSRMHPLLRRRVTCNSDTEHRHPSISRSSPRPMSAHSQPVTIADSDRIVAETEAAVARIRAARDRDRQRHLRPGNRGRAGADHHPRRRPRPAHRRPRPRQDQAGRDARHGVRPFGRAASSSRPT